MRREVAAGPRAVAWATPSGSVSAVQPVPHLDHHPLLPARDVAGDPCRPLAAPTAADRRPQSQPGRKPPAVRHRRRPRPPDRRRRRAAASARPASDHAPDSSNLLLTRHLTVPRAELHLDFLHKLFPGRGLPPSVAFLSCTHQRSFSRTRSTGASFTPAAPRRGPARPATPVRPVRHLIPSSTAGGTGPAPPRRARPRTRANPPPPPGGRRRGRRGRSARVTRLR